MYNVSWCVMGNGVATCNAVCYSKESAEQMRMNLLSQSCICWCVISYAGE